MADYLKVTAKNIAGGPRIFNAAPPVILQRGESTDGEVDISEAELESMKLYGEFEITEGEVSESADETSVLDGTVSDVKAALGAMTVDQLDKLRAEEVAGKNRAGALTAIDEAIAAKSAE